MNPPHSYISALIVLLQICYVSCFSQTEIFSSRGICYYHSFVPDLVDSIVVRSCWCESQASPYTFARSGKWNWWCIFSFVHPWSDHRTEEETRSKSIFCYSPSLSWAKKHCKSISSQWKGIAQYFWRWERCETTYQDLFKLWCGWSLTWPRLPKSWGYCEGGHSC